MRARWGQRLLRFLAALKGPRERLRPEVAIDAREDRGLLKEQLLATRRYDDSKWTAARVRRAIWCGERPEPIPSWTGLIEDVEEEKVGIACSGGGIRSAAFNLGALQVLQDAEVLPRARYLAGVSGGSYIAAAFCMVRKTWRTGQTRPPKPDFGWDDSNPKMVTSKLPPFFRGSPEEQFLRNRSSYLAPGMFGKIRFGYRLVLGMTLNLLFIALAIAAIAAPLGLLYGAIFPPLTAHVIHGGICLYGSERVACDLLPLHLSKGLWLPVVYVTGAGVVLGAASILAYRWGPFVTQVTEVWSLRIFLFGLGSATVLIGLPLLLSLFRAWGTVSHVQTSATGLVHAAKGEQPAAGSSTTTAIAAGGGGVATLGGAVLLQLRAEWAEAQRAIKEIQTAQGWLAKLSPKLRRWLAYAIAAIVGPLLALAFALEAMSVVLNIEHPGDRWIAVGVLFAGFLGSYLLADMTTWSLHSFYRRRLCSAFALKRVALDEGDPHFPQIADHDAGKAVARNHRRLVPLSETAIDPTDGGDPWPTLLVCAAANISDTAATPPGRAVTSFTFSATAMGGPLVGGVKTRSLEDVCDEVRRRYFSLPAAVAMSGAALSPSMGKMTRAPVRFLLGLANVRLGVWVPNPRRLALFKEARKPERREGENWVRWQLRILFRSGKGHRHYPKPRPSYLLRELFGVNPLNSNFLYVTDGGHYENLGLVELLRRGCTEVYCFDASNDNFDAIGDAVSLARSELKVKVDINCAELKLNKESGVAEKDCVEAKITYPNGAASGVLYYSRLVMTKDEAADVMAYKNRDARFPHDPTTPRPTSSTPTSVSRHTARSA